MPDTSFVPLAGMNTQAEDASLLVGGDSQRHYVRDALNIDLTPAGKAELRPGIRKVSDKRFKNLWQSPLHGDTFATLDGQWVKVDPETWAHEVIGEVGYGEVWHEVLNNQVIVSAPHGIFTFDGVTAGNLNIEQPSAPMPAKATGDLPAGTYKFAVSWLRGEQESALSEESIIESDGKASFSLTLPMAMDSTITGVRLYVSPDGGGDLLRYEDYPATTTTAMVSGHAGSGAPPMFRYLSQMPAGKYLKYWNGRLLVAQANVLRFSEALAYHLHDERHGFVSMPQRITFIQPVTGGIWVGQADHVAFLQGTAPDDLTMIRKASRPPVPGSAILAYADTLGSELAPGGDGAAVWLADNGYVVGTPQGMIVELHRQVMGGITAQQGTSVVLEQRLLTAVT